MVGIQDLIIPENKTTILDAAEADVKEIHDQYEQGLVTDGAARLVGAPPGYVGHQEHFPPELWGRIDEKLLFTPLPRSDLREIARLLLLASSAALNTTRNISLKHDDALLDFLLDNGGIDEATGARPLRMVVKRLVETPVAEALLRGDLKDGDLARIGVDHDQVVIRKRR